MEKYGLAVHWRRIQKAEPRGNVKMPTCPRRFQKRPLFISVAVLLVGIALSFGVSWSVLQDERDKLRHDLEEHLFNHLVSIETGLRGNLFVLEALAAYYQSDEGVSRSGFHTFAASLLHEHPSIQALEWVPRVPAAERGDFEEVARRDGLSGSGIMQTGPQGRPVPAEERVEYFPVHYVEPLDGNEPAVFLDLGSDAIRLAALAAARDTGSAAVTGRIVVVQESGDQYGVIVVRPVYRRGAPTQTIGDRRRSLAGFVAAVLRVGDLVQRSMAPMHAQSDDFHMAAFVFDMTARAGERLLSPKGAKADSPDDLPHDIRVERSLSIGGRDWVLVAQPSTAFSQSKQSSYHLVVFGAGLVVTILLTVFLRTVAERATDRRAAARSLRESESLLRSVLDNSPNGIVLKDVDGRYLLANKAFMRRVGADEGRLADKALSDLCPDDLEYHRAVAEHEREVVESRLPVVKEREWRNADGNLGTYIIAKFPVLDDAGRVVRLGSISTDITARKQAERRLHDLNRAYLTLSRCNEILVRSAGEEELIDSVCRTIVEIGGYAGAVVGTTEFGEIIPLRSVSQYAVPGTMEAMDIPWDDPACPIVAAVKAQRTQVVNRDDNKSSCAPCGDFMEAHGFGGLAAFPLISGERTIGVLAVFASTSTAFGRNAVSLLEELAGDMAFGMEALRIKADRARAEAEMRKLTRAVEQSPAAIIVTDAEGTIEYVNPKFIEVTGYSSDEAIGAKPSLLKSGEMEAAAYEKLWKTIKSGDEWRGLFHNKRKDGSLFWGEAAISPVLDGDGRITHFIGIQEDVTERLATERRLSHADKMDSLGNLASGIAHDFNNMLLPIGTLTEMVLKRLSPGSKESQRLERVMEATKRAQSLAQQILAFSRTDESQFKTQDISGVTLETVELLKSTLPKSISLDVRIAPEVGAVACDRAQIETVILNLVKNAADAVESGTGDLRIALERMHLAVPLAGQSSTIPSGSYACLSISDTGKGIEPNRLTRIFDPYFTTKAKGKGTGLGLAMVRTIVLKQGGGITVESRLGVGTTFKIFLPLQD